MHANTVTATNATAASTNPCPPITETRVSFGPMVATIGPKDTLVTVIGAQGFVLAAVAFVAVTVVACIRLARFEIRAAD